LKTNDGKPEERKRRKTLSCGGKERMPHHCGLLNAKRVTNYIHSFQNAYVQSWTGGSLASLHDSHLKGVTESTGTRCNLL